VKKLVAIIVAGGALALVGSHPAASQRLLPWCVETDNGNLIDCSFYTHRQCLDRASGDGPCVRNSKFDYYYRSRGLVPPLDIDPNPRPVRKRRH
jgi:hypothetical protein